MNVSQEMMPGHLPYLVDCLALEPDAARRQRLYQKVDRHLDLVRKLKAEVDHFKDKDTDKALHLGQCALEASRLSQHPEAKPLGLWAYALGLTVQGRFEGALKAFAEARGLYEAKGLEVEAARVAMRQIQALAMTGAFGEAIELAKQIRQVLHTHGCERDALTVDNNMGIIYRRLGQFAQAELILESALSGFDRVQDFQGKVLALISLGNVCQEQDRFGKAENYLKEALELAQNLGQTKHVAGTTVNLALLYRGMGRQHEALELLARARRLYDRMPAGPDAALARREEARLLLDVNLLGEAVTLATELVKVFEDQEMTLEQTEALQVLGVAQARQGDLSSAATSLEAARDKWAVMGNQVQTALTNLSIASLQLELRQSAHALALADAARKVLGEAGTPSGQLLAYLIGAQSLLQQGQWQRAQTYLEHAEGRSRQLNVPELSFRTTYLKGKLASGQNQCEPAKELFKQAITELEGVHRALPVAEFRAAYMGDKQAVYEDLIALLVRQANWSETFEYVERAKSRALLERLGDDVALPLSEEDSDTSRVQRQLRQARAKLHRHSAECTDSNNIQPAKLKAVQDSERDVTRLTRELERLAPRNALFHLKDVTKLGELQQQLTGDTTLVEYFSLAGELSALVITRDSVRCVQGLGREDDLRETLEWLRFYFQRAALGEAFVQTYGEERLRALTNEPLKALHDGLIAPLNLDPTRSRLLIVPCGGLYNVPFAALFDGQAYLSDRYEAALAPSATLYVQCKERSDRALTLLSAFGVSRSLPLVRTELKTIAKHVPSAHLYLDDHATLVNFFAEASEADLVHIAAHGTFRPDNPAFSSLHLQDGALSAKDLYATRLKASLVVLSACQSGRVNSLYGDDLFGLLRGFLDAGAKALVSTLWSVKDAQTACFMDYFYEALSADMSIAGALKKAQRRLRERYPNPYYWAAFTVMGDADRTLLFGH